MEKQKPQSSVEVLKHIQVSELLKQHKYCNKQFILFDYLFFSTELKLYKMKPVLERSNNTNLLVVQLPCIFMLKKHTATSSGYLAHQYTEYCRAGIFFLLFPELEKLCKHLQHFGSELQRKHVIYLFFVIYAENIFLLKMGVLL